MKKICIFNESVSRSGGIERVTINLANMWADHGYDVTIVIIQRNIKTFYELDKRVKIISLNCEVNLGLISQIKNFLVLPLRLRRVIKENSFDIVLAIWTSRAIISILATVFMDIKVVACEHIAYEKAKIHFRIIRKLLYRFADAIVILTDDDRGKYRRINKNTFVIGNFIDDIESYGNNRANKTVLAVGRQTYQKGFDMLLNSWANVYKKHPDWQLKIVGDDKVDVIYSNALKEQIKQLNIQKGVCICGETNDISHEYNNADFFVMSSRFEGLPMVLLEAMSTGLPVVSFDCPTGPSKIIKHKENGFLVEKNNIQLLSEYMNKMIENTQMRLKMSFEAKKTIEVNFSRNAIREKWDKLFCNLDQ